MPGVRIVTTNGSGSWPGPVHPDLHRLFGDELIGPAPRTVAVDRQHLHCGRRAAHRRVGQRHRLDARASATRGRGGAGRPAYRRRRASRACSSASTQRRHRRRRACTRSARSPRANAARARRDRGRRPTRARVLLAAVDDGNDAARHPGWSAISRSTVSSTNGRSQPSSTHRAVGRRARRRPRATPRAVRRRAGPRARTRKPLDARRRLRSPGRTPRRAPAPCARSERLAVDEQRRLVGAHPAARAAGEQHARGGHVTRQLPARRPRRRGAASSRRRPSRSTGVRASRCCAPRRRRPRPW